MLQSCVCPCCGRAWIDSAGPRPGERIVFGRVERTCDQCGEWDVIDRYIIAAIRARRVEDRPLTKQQEQWLRRHRRTG